MYQKQVPCRVTPDLPLPHTSLRAYGRRTMSTIVALIRSGLRCVGGSQYLTAAIWTMLRKLSASCSYLVAAEVYFQAAKEAFDVGSFPVKRTVMLDRHPAV